MPEITRVWLIRHGEPVSEIHGRCYGALDIGLSDAGRRQVDLVSRRLAGETFSAIYASPRLRTAQSAAILAQPHACPVSVESKFCEIDFGDFEGLTYDEIARRHPELYRQWMETPTRVHFPNGESFAQMRRRVVDAFTALRYQHRGATVALVAHGGVIRILLGQALSMPDECLFRMGQRYAAMNLLTYLDDYPSVELLNGSPGSC